MEYKNNTINKKWWLGLFILGLLFFTNIVMAAPNSRSPLGVNTNEIMDDDASIPFIDVFKTSLPFEEARPWLTKGKIVYDQYGWPKNLNGGQVGTRFLYKLPKGTVPEGLYTVLYDGEGILTYSDDAKLVFREKGKDIIKITAGSDREFRVKLIIKHSNPANYLRNIRVLLPGGICANNKFRRVNSAKQCRGSKYYSFEKYYDKLVFNPEYLNYMKDFKVIRFMNMSGITRNPISRWDQRPRLNNATWAGKQGVRGAPLEIMVALANMLNADPWFNLPHKADNDYVRRYAQYVKQHLKPGLKAYVEYTNEAWNTIFDQAHYVKDQGERLHLDSDRQKAGYKYFSMRTVQIFDIWEQVFGGTSRIVRVMGSWAGWTRSSEMLLSYRNAYKKTDAIAIAPYFFPKLASSKRARSVAQLFKMMYDPRERYSIPSVIKDIRKNAEMAKRFGVDLIAYEGGQHLVDWKSRSVNSHPTKLFIAANKDMRMAKAYTTFLRGWKANGGKLFVTFSAPRTYQWFGSWGTKEYISQPLSKAPKHRALLSFIKRNPCWWSACTATRIARQNKPARNPIPNVFALVKSSGQKHRPKTVVANNARSVIGTSVPTARVQAVSRTSFSTAANRVLANSRASANRTALATRTASANRAAALARNKQRARLQQQQVIKQQQARRQQLLARKQQELKKQQLARKRLQIARRNAGRRNTPLNLHSIGLPNRRPNTRVNNNNARAAIWWEAQNLAKVRATQQRRAQVQQPHSAVSHHYNGQGRMWNNNASLRLSNIISGKIQNGRDLSAVWQSHWDDRFLYIRVDTIDDMFVRDSKVPWNDDSIELYIDADGNRSSHFDGKNDFHLIYRWKDQSVSLSKNSPHKGNLGIRQTMIRTDQGYTLETSIPWSTLGVRPIAGRMIGIDVQINDDDSGRGRDGKLAWHSKNDNAWRNPQNFGRVLLGG